MAANHRLHLGERASCLSACSHLTGNMRHLLERARLCEVVERATFFMREHLARLVRRRRLVPCGAMPGSWAGHWPRAPGGMGCLLVQKQLWATPGRLIVKACVLHLSVFPCVAWASGTRQWTQWEVNQIRVAQTHMTWRAAHWFPNIAMAQHCEAYGGQGEKRVSEGRDPR